MELKGPDELVMMVGERTGSRHVHQASSGSPWLESDAVGTEPVADIFTGRHDVPNVAVSPNCQSYSETYGGGAALYYEGVISDLDCGSVEDRERDTSEDWCDSAFRNGYGAFTIRCRRLCSVANCFRMRILPICLYRIMRICLSQHYRFSRMRWYLWSPLIWIGLFGLITTMDRRIGQVSVEICHPPIHSDTLDVGISHGDTEWLCLLYSANSGSAGDDTVAIRFDGNGLDHWRGVVWDPGIMGQQCLHVCYNCLCLMVLFRNVMLLVHDWAAWSI